MSKQCIDIQKGVELRIWYANGLNVLKNLNSD